MGREITIAYPGKDANIYPMYHLGLYVDSEGKHVSNIKHAGDQTAFELILIPDV